MLPFVYKMKYQKDKLETAPPKDIKDHLQEATGTDRRKMKMWPRSIPDILNKLAFYWNVTFLLLISESCKISCLDEFNFLKYPCIIKTK